MILVDNQKKTKQFVKKFNVNLDLDTDHPISIEGKLISKSIENSSKSGAILKKTAEPVLKARIISSSSIMLKSASTPMTQKSSARAKITTKTNNNQSNTYMAI